MPTLGLILLSLAVTAPAPTPEPISLDEVLRAVQSSHPLFSRERRRADIERQLQARAEGARDWRFFSSANYAYQEPVQDGPFVPEQVQDVEIEVGVDRTIWETGGTLRASWSGGYLDQRVPGLTVGPVAVPASHAQMYRSAAFVSYSQPLWKNLGGVLNTVDFELAGAAVEIAELQATENQEAFLLDIAARFVDWAVLVEEARVSGERLMLAEAQLSQTQKQRRANLVGRADVLRAVDAVQEARQTVYLVESRVAATREELAVLTGLVDLGGRAPAIDLYATTPLDGITSVTESARLVRVLDATARQVGIRTAAAAEATRPDLLLSAGIGLRRDGDDAAEALGLKKPDAFVGLTFSLPLGNRSAQAELERTRLERQQVADRMREVTLQLDATLRSLRIQLEQLEHVLQLNTQQIESATKKTREELRLYSQGRGQLTFVIASRDDVQRAKLNYARNAGAYQQLLLRYREVVDQLLPADGDAHGGRR